MDTTGNATKNKITVGDMQEKIERELAKDKARVEWIDKLREFIKTTYPDGVKVTKHVQRKLDAVFGDGVCHLNNNSIEVDGQYPFELCHSSQAWATAESFENHNGGSYKVSQRDILELEAALLTISAQVGRYNTLLAEIEHFNSNLATAFPMGRLEIRVETRNNYGK